MLLAIIVPAFVRQQQNTALLVREVEQILVVRQYWALQLPQPRHF
jgi:hypothetical protein